LKNFTKKLKSTIFWLPLYSLCYKFSSLKVLNDEEQEGMRVAGRLGREVLDEAARVIAPGVTTDEIDRVVH
jgi:methionyl aminopeptidase